MLPKIKNKVIKEKVFEKIAIFKFAITTVPPKEVIPAHQNSSVKPDFFI